MTPGDLGRQEGYHEGASLPCWMADGKGILYQTGSGVAADGMELRVVSPAGGAPRVLVRRGAVGSLTRHACGPDAGTVYVTTRHEDNRHRFWAIPVSGGTPRLLLELDRLALGVSYLTTDGRTLFFTLPVQEPDVWVVEFRK